jgi:hypothetical protein
MCVYIDVYKMLCLQGVLRCLKLSLHGWVLKQGTPRFVQNELLGVQYRGKFSGNMGALNGY